MKPERWQLVSRIYHDALARDPRERDAFLRAACGTDAAMRQEIASLLAQPSGDGFLAEPAWTGGTAPATASSFTGQRLGPYQLEELIGAGGMGQVYRAHDPKLGREVAIKILPPIFTSQSDRLSRFEREARVLASLNHPHIAAIYGFEEASDLRGLVLELVDGETLAERLTRKPITVPEAIDIARAIADALDTAHEKGIVHRDLKPANVKIRSDGTVKVLDFGLAKALNDPEPSLSTTTGLSADGLILGTPAYMSPEQARGKPVDKRADVWAFGCLLFEMLSGRPAFGGQTASDTLASVLDREPDPSVLPRATPGHVRRLLQRCLAKDPKQRLRDIGDARLELEAGAEPARAAITGPRSAWWRSRAVAWSIATVSLAIAAWLIADRSRAGNSGLDVSLERLTYDPGLTTMPALSPGGDLLAYASDRFGRGDLDIWVTQTAGGAPLRLTDDPANDHSPDFSPDGKQIVFRSDRGGGGIYLMSALGGPARRLFKEGYRPRFSSDGTRISYWTGPTRGLAPLGGTAVFVAPLDGGAPTRLAANLSAARDPLWAPDGRSLVVLGRRADDPPSEPFDWWWVPVDGVPPVKIGLYSSTVLRDIVPIQNEGSPAAWHTSGVLFAARGDVWSIPISATNGRPTGPAVRLTAITDRVSHATSSRDGTIVFASTQAQRVIERVSLGADTLPQRLYADNRRVALRPSITADGTLVAFEQYYEGSREIWTLDVRSGRQQMVLQTDNSVHAGATLSRDGEQIVYAVAKTNAVPPSSFIVDVSGGVPRQICERCELYGFLSDNRRVLAVWDDWTTLGTIDVRSGARMVLARSAQGRLSRPHASPDDKWLAFRGFVGGAGSSFLVPLTPGRPVPRESWQELESTGTGRPAGWSPDSRTVYTFLDTDGFRCLWGHRVDPRTGQLTGGPFPVRHFHQQIDNGPSTSFGNPITADGLIYEGVYPTGDLWRLAPAARAARE
jgi:eukaryotic-like serine/threonine-protein kinase